MTLPAQSKRTLEENGWTFRWIVATEFIWAIIGGVVGAALAAGELAAGICGTVLISGYLALGWWIGGQR